MGQPITFKLVDMLQELEHLEFKYWQQRLQVALMFSLVITMNVLIKIMVHAPTLPLGI